MPFRDYPNFDADTLRILTQAYDSAVDELARQNIRHSASKLASLLVLMVRGGERDPTKLCERAVTQLKSRQS